jgi:hypothetical protein
VVLAAARVLYAIALSGVRKQRAKITPHELTANKKTDAEKEKRGWYGKGTGVDDGFIEEEVEIDDVTKTNPFREKIEISPKGGRTGLTMLARVFKIPVCVCVCVCVCLSVWLFGCLAVRF